MWLCCSTTSQWKKWTIFWTNITLIHPNSSTKATLLWREGNLGVLGCGVTRWQSRNCKKTRVKLYRTCVAVCKSHKQLDNKINVCLLQIPRKKTQGRPWWGGVTNYIYNYNMYVSRRTTTRLRREQMTRITITKTAARAFVNICQAHQRYCHKQFSWDWSKGLKSKTRKYSGNSSKYCFVIKL